MEIHTPSFRLLCACCRWPKSPEQISAIAAACADGIDWEQFRALIEFHRVAGLVHAALNTTALEPPQPFRDWLTARVQSIARGNLLQLHESIRLQRLFAKANIDCRTVKGVSLAQHVYGTVALKQNRDIDFAVAPRDIHKALALAISDGYDMFDPATDLSRGQVAAFTYYGKEFALRKAGGVLLEIHSRLTNNPALLREDLLDRTGQEIGFGAAQSLRTLNDSDLFAYLCAHGSDHSWSRLKWLADVNALLARSPGEEARLNARAEALGAKWCAVQAQMLCAQLFDRPLPDAIKALTKTRRAQRLVRHCYHAMFIPARGAAPEPLRELRDAVIHAQLGSGWRFWLGVMRSQSVKSSIILELNLPEKLIFLYPVIRPFFWVWFRVVSPRGRYRLSQKGVDTTT